MVRVEPTKRGPMNSLVREQDLCEGLDLKCPSQTPVLNFWFQVYSISFGLWNL